MERIGQNVISSESQWQSPHTPSIHILDDDSLLNIFHLYRPAVFDGDEHDDHRLFGGKKWYRERWWYQLVHVCQRWRDLIFRSASHLDLCLVCTFGTPITDMLANSPPFPLIIDYPGQDHPIAAECENEIIFALEQHHERVRRIRLFVPTPNIERLITVIEGEYPILEYLILATPIEDKSTGLMLTETFHAPHLRHLQLTGIAIPIGSRLLTTAVGLIVLALNMKHPSGYLQPNTLLQWISFMPELEMLAVFFGFPVLSRDVERQLMRAPITTHVTLPNLLGLTFRGASAYMEAFVPHITTSRLEKCQIALPNQLTISIPRLLQFINTTENLRFNRAAFLFYDERVTVGVYPDENAKAYSLSLVVDCWHLDWQVSSAVQISNALSQKFSAVVYLTFGHEEHSRSSGERNEVDRNEWRKLLMSFNNVKTLDIRDYGLVGEFSHCLQLDDGEHPLELLPELQELIFLECTAVGDAFAKFIDARKNAGRPVTLTRR